jgi:hypothetical protein
MLAVEIAFALIGVVVLLGLLPRLTLATGVTVLAWLVGGPLAAVVVGVMASIMALVSFIDDL